MFFVFFLNKKKLGTKCVFYIFIILVFLEKVVFKNYKQIGLI